MRKLFWIPFLIALVSVLVFGSFAPTPSAPLVEKFELRAVVPWPPGHIRSVELWGWFKKKVEERTQGRVTIKVFYSSELFSMKEAYDGVKKGLADMASAAISLIPGRMPLWVGIDTPFACKGDLFWQNAAMREMLEVIGETRYGVLTLFSQPTPPYHLFMKTMSIKTLDDLKGVKIRGLGGMLGQGLEVVGATNVVISTAEVPTALMTGVVDGVITYFGTAAKSYPDQVKYVTLVGYCMSAGLALVNLDTWNKLPKDIQEIMRITGREAELRSIPIIMGEEEELKKKFIKAGVSVIEFPAADRAKWFGLSLPILDEWAAKHGDIGKKIAEIVKKHS